MEGVGHRPGAGFRRWMMWAFERKETPTEY